MNENVNYKIYKFKEKHILVYNCDTKSYTFYPKEGEPFKQITSEGWSSSDFEIYEEIRKYFRVWCPYLCRECNILVNKDDIKEVDLNNPKILYKFLNFLEDFHKETIKSIKKAIDVCLFTGKYE